MAGDLSAIREAHASEVYGYYSSHRQCPSSDVPAAACHTCIVLAELDRARPDHVRAALGAIRTHNDQPLSPQNLRWAATHEALCRSFIFDVLTGLADALDPLYRPVEDAS